MAIGRVKQRHLPFRLEPQQVILGYALRRSGRADTVTEAGCCRGGCQYRHEIAP